MGGEDRDQWGFPAGLRWSPARKYAWALLVLSVMGLVAIPFLLAAGERVLEAVLLGVLGLPLSIAVLVWTKGRS
jgi:hypothetical protein